MNDNSKPNNHNNKSPPPTSNETTTSAVGLRGPTNNEDDSRSHLTVVSSSPNSYSIHSLLNHSQYNLHSNEYSIKRSHQYHGPRINHHIGKRPLV